MRSWKNIGILAHTCAGLLLSALALPAHAFVYIVDSSADLADADTGDGICQTSSSTCTLRAAIQQANAWPGTDSIVLPAGTYTLSIAGAGENAAASGDLDITDTLNLGGAGAAAAIIDGGGIDRVVDIAGGVAVRITGVTIRNGATTGSGGGIYNLGTLTLADSIVTGNTSALPTGIAGGGIYHFSSGEAAVSLSLDRVTVSNNSADNSALSGAGSINGGGIAIVGGAVTINESLIDGNTATTGAVGNTGNTVGSGGGVYVNNGNVSITDSTVSGNTADWNAGGIYNFGALTITGSTISGNTAFQGGGVYTDGNAARLLTLVNSTVSGNVTTHPSFSTLGGGLFISKPTVIQSSTITDNEAGDGAGIWIDTTGLSSLNQGSATLTQTVIASQAVGPNCNSAVTSNLTSNGYNLASDATCALTGSGDLNSTAANLAALSALNGGPTPTHLPQAGSAAIDSGNNANCPTEDQRSFPRPADGNGDSNAICDIGATEVTPGTNADLAVRLSDAPDPIAVGATLTYTLSATNHGPDPATGASLTLTLPASAGFQSASAGCALGGATVTCNIGALAAGAGVVRTVTVTPNTLGTITASAAASAAETDPNPANNTGIQASTSVYQPTDITIATTAATTGTIIRASGAEVSGGNLNECIPNNSCDTVLAGEPFTYTLTIGNTTATARNVRIIDTLPSGVDPVSLTASTGTCSAAGRIFTCTLGDLPVGGAVATIDITVNPTDKGVIVNRAVANFDGGFLTAPGLDEFSLNVDTRADLAVDIVDSADPVAQNADLGLIITVNNGGPSDATAVTLVVTLPASYTYNSTASPDGWSCTPSGVTVNCTLATLPSDTLSTLTLFVTPTATGTLNASVAVSGSDTDVDTSNNTAAESTTIGLPVGVVSTDLSVVLSTDPAPPRTAVAGDNLTYISRATNNGTATAENVTITQVLPAGVSYVSATNGCSESGGVVQCNLGTIAGDTNASARVVVRPAAAGTLSSTVTVLGGNVQDPDTSNNTDTETTTVSAADDGNNGGLHKGSGCFIATAAYGSYLDPHVMSLRRFRDDVLLATAPGHAFVEFYYRVSPPIADVIGRHEALRAITRWTLTPLVYGVEYPVPTAALGVALLAGFLRFRRNREA
ncbi:MAG: DUF11 domain-containing protein [Gammaproteobacteria bacterium]|nr:DUF11 domain-containing protein [Gammaproteobacteria bacterium]